MSRLTNAGNGQVSKPGSVPKAMGRLSCPATVMAPCTGAAMEADTAAGGWIQAPIRSPLAKKPRPSAAIGARPPADAELRNSNRSVLSVPAAMTTRGAVTVADTPRWRSLNSTT